MSPYFFTTQVEIQGIMRVWMMMLLHLSCFFSPSKLPPPHVGDDLGHGVQIGLQKVTPCCVGKYLPKIGNDSQSAQIFPDHLFSLCSCTYLCSTYNCKKNWSPKDFHHLPTYLLPKIGFSKPLRSDIFQVINFHLFSTLILKVHI